MTLHPIFRATFAAAILATIATAALAARFGTSIFETSPAERPWTPGPMWGSGSPPQACPSERLSEEGWSDPGAGMGKVGAGEQPLELRDFEDISGPPRIAGGQVYDVTFVDTLEPGARCILRVKWPRTWRLAITADVPVSMFAFDANCDIRKNPQPSLRRVPAAPPFKAAYEVDLRAGWYDIAFQHAKPPPLKLLAQPIGEPR